MEHVGFDPEVVHPPCTPCGSTTWRARTKPPRHVPGAMDAFHVYAVEWERERIRTFVDGREYFTFAREPGGADVWPFDAPQHLC